LPSLTACPPSSQAQPKRIRLEKADLKDQFSQFSGEMCGELMKIADNWIPWQLANEKNQKNQV
jgi:hypothetical protein